MSMINAVVYARYSSHGQTEQSIEGQLHDAYDFAAREGYTIIGEYIDRALTGRSDNRADFQRMIADSAKRQFSVVLVWKLDRFARNRYDSAIYKAKLKKNGVRVISVKENLTDTPEGIILEGMLESMAEYYSANLSVNVKRGQRETLAKGRFCGGPVPLGYKAVDGKLVHDEKTVPLVRHVFEQYASGVPKKEIVDELTKRGVKSPRGAVLSATSFQTMLTNPVYIGKYTRAGVVYENCAEPIISEELFNKVQLRLAARKRAPAALRAKEEYLLQGKAFCGHCGAKMTGESGKSGSSNTMYHYYSCVNRKKHHVCKKKNERKYPAETYVVERTLAYVLAPNNITRIAKRVVEEYDKEFAASKIAEMERAVARMDHELNKLVDALIEAPKAAHKRIYEKMENLEVQKADLEQDLAKQRIASGIRYTQHEVIAWIKQFCKGDVNDPDFCKHIIDVFINSVYFYDDRITIFYNIRGGKSEIPPLSAIPAPSPESSDIKAYVPPNNLISEPQFIFANGVFGCIFPRWEE